MIIFDKQTKDLVVYSEIFNQQKMYIIDFCAGFNHIVCKQYQLCNSYIQIHSFKSKFSMVFQAQWMFDYAIKNQNVKLSNQCK